METKQYVVGYARTSKKEENDKQHSIPAQTRAIENFCKSNNLILLGTHVDEGISSHMPLALRPSGKNLISDISNHHYKPGLVITKLDRAFRRAGEGLVCLSDWGNKGRGIYILNFFEGKPYDSRDPMSKAMLGLMSVFAELERDMIAQRIKDVLSAQKQQQKTYCKQVYGYQNSNGKLVPIPEEQEVIKLIITLRTEGKSLRYIATFLTNAGYAPPRQDTKQWYASSISEILQNSLREIEL